MPITQETSVLRHMPSSHLNSKNFPQHIRQLTAQVVSVDAMVRRMKELLFPELADRVEPMLRAFCPHNDELDDVIGTWRGAVYVTPVLGELFKALGLSVKVILFTINYV